MNQWTCDRGVPPFSKYFSPSNMTKWLKLMTFDNLLTRSILFGVTVVTQSKVISVDHLNAYISCFHSITHYRLRRGGKENFWGSNFPSCSLNPWHHTATHLASPGPTKVGLHQFNEKKAPQIHPHTPPPPAHQLYYLRGTFYWYHSTTTPSWVSSSWFWCHADFHILLQRW